MGASDRELVKQHLEPLIAAAAASGMSEDVLGRLLLEAAVDLWRRSRAIDDIAGELGFTADNLDPDIDYNFIRP